MVWFGCPCMLGGSLFILKLFLNSFPPPLRLFRPRPLLLAPHRRPGVGPRLRSRALPEVDAAGHLLRPPGRGGGLRAALRQGREGEGHACPLGHDRGLRGGHRLRAELLPLPGGCVGHRVLDHWVY